MTHKRVIWCVLVAAAIILLLYLAPAYAPRSKARSQPGRIANVNRVASVSMVLTNTNAPTSPDR